MNIKVSVFRKIFFIIAYLTLFLTIILILNSDAPLPFYMVKFIKELSGCAVFSFVLALDTYIIEEIKNKRR